MNTTIFKKIGETIKTQVPHPTLIGIGISLGVTAVIAALAYPSHLAHAGFILRPGMGGGP